ncbi:MAG: hypothetical protein ACK5JS_05320 [Mangrovibacterium sp.]
METLRFKRFFGACLFLFGAIFMTACSDDKEGLPAPVFPDSDQSTTLEPGGSTDLTFEANQAWSITSSMPWCKFAIADETPLASINGQAGEVTLCAVVDATAWAFTDSKAEITLRMGEESKVIATITRPSRVHEITAKGKAGAVYSEENPLVIAWNEDNTQVLADSLVVTANFSWVLTVPSWITADAKTFVGEPDVETTVYDNQNLVDRTAANIVSPQEGEFVFTDEAGTVFLSVPVRYEGLPDEFITFTGSHPILFNYVVDYIGSEFWYVSNDGTPSDTTAAPLKVNIESKLAPENLIIQGLEVLGTGRYGVLPAKWFTTQLTQEGQAESGANNYSLAITPQATDVGTDREVSILVLPATVFDESLSGDIANIFGTNYEIKAEYRKYLAIGYVQQLNKSYVTAAVTIDFLGDRNETGENPIYKTVYADKVESPKYNFGTQNVFEYTITGEIPFAVEATSAGFSGLAGVNIWPYKYGPDYETTSAWWSWGESSEGLRMSRKNYIGFTLKGTVPTKAAEAPMVFVYGDKSAPDAVLILRAE